MTLAVLVLLTQVFILASPVETLALTNKQYNDWLNNTVGQDEYCETYIRDAVGNIIDIRGGVQVLDTDDDGLNDVDEFFYGTDPGNPDTDGDGIPDGQDV